MFKLANELEAALKSSLKQNDTPFTVSAPALISHENEETTISISLQLQSSRQLEPNVRNIKAFKSFIQREFATLPTLKKFRVKEVTAIAICITSEYIVHKWQLNVIGGPLDGMSGSSISIQKAERPATLKLENLSLKDV